MDEALSRVVLDFSGRPSLNHHVEYSLGSIGSFDVDLFEDFFHGCVNHAKVTLHIDNIREHHTHHQTETVFKTLGRALLIAITADIRMAGMLPSTKGRL